MVFLVPPVRHCDGQVCFYRFLRPLDTKNERKTDKKAKKKMIFQALTVTSRTKKFNLKAQFWCTMGLWWGTGICKSFSECLFVLSKQLEGSKVTSTKIWHFSPDIHKVNEAPDEATECGP